MRRFPFRPSFQIFLILIVAMTVSICGICFWTRTPRNGRASIKKQNRTNRTLSIVEMMGSSDVFEVVKPNISTILMEPRNPFVEGTSIPGIGGRRRPFAVILVTSMARYVNHRHVIRHTWYKWASQLNIRVFFMIGFDNGGDELLQILGEEQRRYNDLIIDDYEEGYYRLSGKVLRMLKWFNSTYTDASGPRFLIKTDHDVFLNLPNIVAALEKTPYYKNLMSQTDCKDELYIHENESKTNLINENASGCPVPDDVNLALDPSNPDTYFVGGKRLENVEMTKDPDSKWYMDSSERERLNWTSTSFPTYLNGPCYIMSGNVVGSIYEASFSVPIYPFEDVYLTGIIANDRLKLHISNMPEMQIDLNLSAFWASGDGEFGFGMFVHARRQRSRLAKILAMHPVERPSIMWRLCKKISSCSALTTSAGAREEVNLLLFLLSSIIGFLSLSHVVVPAD